MSDPADQIKSPDPDEALARVEAGKGASGSDDESKNPMGEESWDFHIDWKHPRTGETSKGNFTNKILTIQDRVSVGNLKAVMANNTPWDAIDPDTQAMLEMMAHLTVSLDKRPRWFKMTDMTNPDLLYAVYDKVSEHEKFFRGSGTAQKAGS